MEIFIGKDGEQLGPFEEKGLLQAISNGEISHADLAWSDGETGWISLGEYLTKHGLMPSTPSPPPLPPKLSATPNRLPNIPKELAEKTIAGVNFKAVFRPAEVIQVASKTETKVSGGGISGYVNIDSDSITTRTVWLKMLDTNREYVLNGRRSDDAAHDHELHEDIYLHDDMFDCLRLRKDQPLQALWIQFPEISIRSWPKEWFDKPWKELPQEITKNTDLPAKAMSNFDAYSHLSYVLRKKEPANCSLAWNAEGFLILVRAVNSEGQHAFNIKKSGLFCAPNLPYAENEAFQTSFFGTMHIFDERRSQAPHKESFFSKLGGAFSNLSQASKDLNELLRWVEDLQNWSTTELLNKA